MGTWCEGWTYIEQLFSTILVWLRLGEMVPVVETWEGDRTEKHGIQNKIFTCLTSKGYLNKHNSYP